MSEIYMCGYCGNKVDIKKIKKDHTCPVCNTENSKFVKVGKHNRHKFKG